MIQYNDSTFTVGADPELFLFDENGPVSAIDKIPGTKEEPCQVKELPKGFMVQVDNCSVEYNIPPVKTGAEFIESNMMMLEYLNYYFNKMGLKVRPVASVEFAPNQLRDPRAWIFGCDPDFNAWTLKTNPPPQTRNKSLRSAGGHFHIGCENYTNMEKVALIRTLDFYVGARLAAQEPKNERSKLYGKPGAMRFKKYGVEWRTPSNYWLESETTISNTINMINVVVDHFNANKENLEVMLPPVLNEALVTREFSKVIPHPIVKRFYSTREVNFQVNTLVEVENEPL